MGSHLMILRVLALLSLAALPLIVHATPYTISDDRVRSLDITPALGRGYSISTNTFASTCMKVNDMTVPSYNYDCKSYHYQ